ncbi:hypothetical protein ACQ4PT_012755 [Festuca glaucescens]
MQPPPRTGPTLRSPTLHISHRSPSVLHESIASPGNKKRGREEESRKAFHTVLVLVCDSTPLLKALWLLPPPVKINKSQTAFVPLQAPNVSLFPAYTPRRVYNHLPPSSTPPIYPSNSPRHTHRPSSLCVTLPSPPRSSSSSSLQDSAAAVVVAMAVQARFLSHAFPHDLRSMEAGTSSQFFGDCAPAVAGIGNNTVLSDLPRSELTCNDNYGFVPRKRARMATEEPAGLAELARQRLVLQQQQPAAMHGLLLPCDAQSRAVGSGAASTSGRVANAAAGVSQGLTALLYNQGVETDALIRLESERMRAGLEQARRRHARAVLAAVERAAAGRLQAVEADLDRARYRNAELQERLRQMTAEGQAWLGAARSHEAVAAGLRATLDQLLQPAGAGAAAVEGDAEDAQSCCFETPAPGDNNADDTVVAAAPSCKACGQGDACVLLLPCRHLSICAACEPAVDTCPVCAATKNASLHVLLS